MANSFTTQLASAYRRVKAIFRLMSMDCMNHNERSRRSSSKSKRRLSSTFDALVAASFAGMELTNQLKLVFKLIDMNGDGKIFSRELSEVLQCLGCEESRASNEAEGMAREMDRNGDGVVDLDEFIGAMNYEKMMYNTNSKDDLMDAFLIFDIDKNGLLSARELQRVLTNLGSNNCSLQDCKHLIIGVDKDGDGFVDFEEFCSMMTHSNDIHV